MFTIPTEYNRVNIVGFDPGSETTGVSVLTIDPQTAHIYSANAWTIKSSKLQAFTGMDPDSHSERMCRLRALSMEVQSIMDTFRPWAVGCEAPFYNRLMPSAYGSLTEVVVYIQNSCISYNPCTRFELLQPQLVKKSVGAAGKKGKDVMREAVKADTALNSSLIVNIDSLDEHAIDALAVARCMLNFRLFV